MSELKILIDRYNQKSYKNSKRWDKYVWYFILSDEGLLTLNRWVPTKRWLLSDMWIDVPVTTQLLNILIQ